MKKIAVILSGCGFQDGSEITEAICTLISLGKYGAQYQCFSIEKSFDSTNHLDGSAGESRKSLVESARIARGEVSPIVDMKIDEFDGLIFPGGFGVAKHLSTWAENGAKCKVDPQIEKIIQTFYSQSKPIGAICIAPVLLAKVLGKKEVTLTIGDDKETALEIEKTGAIHEDCPVDDYVTDRAHKVITTPAYMYDKTSPYKVSLGVDGLVKELVEMA